MNFALNTDPSTLSPLALFLHADWVVRVVMIGLLLASIWTWGIILTFGWRLRAIRSGQGKFEKSFWDAPDIDAFYRAEGSKNLPIARVFSAGVAEWRRSTANGAIDREGTRDRLSTAMSSAIASEVDRLSDRQFYFWTRRVILAIGIVYIGQGIWQVAHS